jgi:hypothetical protein
MVSWGHYLEQVLKIFCDEYAVEKKGVFTTRADQSRLSII